MELYQWKVGCRVSEGCLALKGDNLAGGRMGEGDGLGMEVETRLQRGGVGSGAVETVAENGVGEREGM